MQLYRGALINTDSLFGLESIESKLSLDANVGKISHQQLDTEYHGQVVFATDDRRYAVEMIKMRLVMGMIDPITREAILSGELIPVLLNLEVEESQIYSLEASISRFTGHTEDELRDVLVQHAKVEAVSIINPEHIIKILAGMLEPAAQWAYNLSYFPKEFNNLSYIEDSQKAILAALLDTSNNKQSFDNEILKSLTLADLLYILTRQGNLVVSECVDFVMRYFYVNTGLYKERTMSLSADTYFLSQQGLVDYLYFMQGANSLIYKNLPSIFAEWQAKELDKPILFKFSPTIKQLESFWADISPELSDIKLIEKYAQVYNLK